MTPYDKAKKILDDIATKHYDARKAQKWQIAALNSAEFVGAMHMLQALHPKLYIRWKESPRPNYFDITLDIRP